MTADNGFVGKSAEVLAAVTRVLNAAERSVDLGNPNAIVPVADLMALLHVVRSSGAKASDADLRAINAWVDGQLNEIDTELDGVGTKSREAWSSFEAMGGATAAMLPAEALTLVRIGFLSGYPLGYLRTTHP